MKSPFRWYLIGACALACIAIGQPTLADTQVPSIVGAAVGAPAKAESNAKLTIVSGNNQIFTLPPHPGTPCPYTNGACNFPVVPAKFSALAVKLTNLGGLPIPYAKIVFTCHVPVSWVCQFSPSVEAVSPTNTSISITTDRLGVATLNQMGGNALSTYCKVAPNVPPCGGDLLGGVTNPVTVTAGYGDITSTFNLGVR